MNRYFFVIIMAMASQSLYAQVNPDSLASEEDSLWLRELSMVWQMMKARKVPSVMPNAGTLLSKSDTTSKHPKRIAFNGGFIRYNLNYRSRIDTPFNESDIVQHSLMANANVTIDDRIPLTIVYYERQSNSSIFKDFRDIVVNVNPSELQRLQRLRLQKLVANQLLELKKQVTPAELFSLGSSNVDLQKLLSNPAVVGKLIQAKEKLLFMNERDKVSKYKDSVEIKAKAFVGLYDSLRSRLDQTTKKYDSLELAYQIRLKKIQGLTSLSSRQVNTGRLTRRLIDSLKTYGVETSALERQTSLFRSIKTLSFGRTNPDMSPLTVKNINVKGVNAAFGNERYYFAFTAGMVDFRLRDFVQRSNSQPAQYVYAARGGVGRPEGTHAYLSAFKGKKAIYSFNRPAVEIIGTSLELQYSFHQFHQVKVEIAQSSAPVSVINGVSAGAVKFNFRNETGRAYNVQWKSSFPKMRAKVEAFYQNNGLNFQAFNSYRVNSAAKSWSVRYEQFFFRRQLRVVASARRNDFESPFITQRYSSNTVFKTFQATFRRKKWPSISVGYIPSSQYTVVDSQIYESRYQTFTSSVNHDYKIGNAGAATQALYSKFYNGGSDTGFIYYQAQHFFAYQRLQFALFSTTGSVAITKSPQFEMVLLQGGYQTTLRKIVDLEFGFKITNLNQLITKAGLYARCGLRLPLFGDLSCWYDDSYLPGMGKELFENKQFNVGYTRRFK